MRRDVYEDGRTVDETTSFIQPPAYSTIQQPNQPIPLPNQPSLETGESSTFLKEERVGIDQGNSDRQSGSMDTGCKLKIGGSVAALLAAMAIGFIIATLHSIDEGYVGIYYKYGALMDTYTLPGMHSKDPIASSVVQVLIRPETDSLDSFVASTKDGISISFDTVQVISRIKEKGVLSVIKEHGVNFKLTLVFDRVREEIRKFCAKNTMDDVYNHKFLDMVEEVRTNVVSSIQRLGEGQVEILNLVISKPDIPTDIANNYKQVKVQWTEQLVATQKQKTDQIKLETEQLRAIASAQRKKSVLEITIQEELLQKEGQQNLSRLENQIVKEKEENLANIDKFKKEKAAEANNLLFTKEYIQLQMATALTNNTKFYFSGETSPLGALLSKIIPN